MSDRTELSVTDAIHLSKTKTWLVVVEVLKGQPTLNMKLTSPDVPGQWQIVGFGTMPADQVVSHPNLMNLGLINLEEKNDIQLGSKLVEVE